MAWIKVYGGQRSLAFEITTEMTRLEFKKTIFCFVDCFSVRKYSLSVKKWKLSFHGKESVIAP